ncbi:hypothetical protein [Methylobacterium planeticum]|uniref:Uncharacterized protein n=1 Tax=Methylobacterium planeticum TaxID=2615211 RepID=A0A6N6MSQ2_9HYPH|nr:hypothetical protein [Methylobacterium planeticum]KAB1073350.1 hypothetical protein F6X51_11355 [Methylobacterium planeticum]
MTMLLHTIDPVRDVFEFSTGPQEQVAASADAAILPGQERSDPMWSGRAFRRRLLHWAAAQVAATACLTTCVAYAMAPAALKPLPEPLTYALRLSGESAPPAPLPASLNDGFRLRLSFVDAGE